MAPHSVDPRPIGSQHPRMRELLALRKNGQPTRLLIEGAWEHERLLGSGTEIETFLYCPSVATQRATQLAAEVVRRAGEAYTISERLLTRLSRLGRPDGLVSVARLPSWRPDALRFDASSLVLVADGVEYAGNLGTLIRTVDAARADCLVLTSRRARLTHPTVYAASRGMVLSTPVVCFDRIADAAGWLRQHGFRVHLAEPGAESNYRELPYAGSPTAFVVGSEGSGLSAPWRSEGFSTVSIPMLGQADSLNVALSAGLLLFEARARKDGW